jgi:hypothetical protein
MLQQCVWIHGQVQGQLLLIHHVCHPQHSMSMPAATHSLSSNLSSPVPQSGHEPPCRDTPSAKTPPQRTSPPCLTVSTWSTAMLMPLRRSMGFMPAATDLQPSFRMARANTVAVVVPEGGKEVGVWASVSGLLTHGVCYVDHSLPTNHLLPTHPLC